MSLNERYTEKIHYVHLIKLINYGQGNINFIIFVIYIIIQ